MARQHMRYITLPSGDDVPVFGQGTWFMGERGSDIQREVQTLRQGIERGLSLIDTAEMYADGGAERVVGAAIKGCRDDVFLVSKVLPGNASAQGTIAACEGSLKRLGTEYIDLYLLHWRGHIPLEETINAMEDLVEQGKIGQWGVSNFDVDDLEELLSIVDNEQIATNQVLYNLSRRGIEYDLLPWCRSNSMPVMAYSPIEQARLLEHPALVKVAKRHHATPAQIALAWVLRDHNIITIPKASSVEHMIENIGSLSIHLEHEDYVTLDAAFPPPSRKKPLEML
ncbi:aldo/keto reductase [Jinshanibacter sp. LJY008]|uniref:Aldo/keto reductase n=1 Tax=Limnobaculum eriocheiris TaxID=2897391 RepID=A0A9X1MUK6_9GAMM|nr:aldo/keto reductase [Limnobaculum eriocheiris]MCD1125229.1 aldo/keto reductase [Limnobaculum eriocheiris]